MHVRRLPCHCAHASAGVCVCVHYAPEPRRSAALFNLIFQRCCVCLFLFCATRRIIVDVMGRYFTGVEAPREFFPSLSPTAFTNGIFSFPSTGRSLLSITLSHSPSLSFVYHRSVVASPHAYFHPPTRMTRRQGWKHKGDVMKKYSLRDCGALSFFPSSFSLPLSSFSFLVKLFELSHATSSTDTPHFFFALLRLRTSPSTLTFSR